MLEVDKVSRLELTEEKVNVIAVLIEVVDAEDRRGDLRRVVVADAPVARIACRRRRVYLVVVEARRLSSSSCRSCRTRDVRVGSRRTSRSRRTCLACRTRDTLDTLGSRRSCRTRRSLRTNVALWSCWS